jgi:nitrogen fixation NifU-like protein
MNLRELYQEIIIDHNQHPRNHYVMKNPTAEAQGYNPLCGDKLTVYLDREKDVLKNISFVGCGCAISQASASLMTESLLGKTTAEAHELFEKFHAMVMSSEEPPSLSLDKLTVLAGVRSFPARVKCATLAWHTLEAALKQQNAPVTTE